jgi:D-alanyl-D-alanine carboxypeptidase
LPIAVLSNTPYSTCLVDWTNYLNGQPWRVGIESINRFVRTGAAVRDFQPGPIGEAVDYAFDILADVGAGITYQSFVYDAEFGRIYYRTLQNPEIRFIDFQMFDPDCDAPVKMLDVNADLTGDISDDFYDFDYDLSLAFYTLCVNHFGYPVTIPLADIMTHFAAFACTAEPPAVTFYGAHLTDMAPWINRITVYNDGREAEMFTLEVFDTNGIAVLENDYEVPAFDSLAIVLPAMAGYVAAPGEIILPPVEGTFTIRTTGRYVRPKLSYRYGDSLSLAEFFLQDTLAGEYLLPNPVMGHFDWTGIALLNPYAETVRAELAAYRDGVLQLVTTVDIAPHTKYVRLSDTLWPGLAYTDFDQVRVTSMGEPLPTPMSITGNNAQDRHVFFNGAATPDETTAPVRYFGVHVTDFAPWISQIVAYNNGEAGGDFTLTVYGADGLVNHVQAYQAPPHSALNLVMSADPAYTPAAGEIMLPPVEGAFVIETSNPKVRPVLSYRYGDSESVASFFLQDTRTDAALLPNTVLDHFSWTGVAVFNPGDEPLPVTVEAFGDGARVGARQVEIPARQKYVRLSEGIWADLGYPDLDQIRVVAPDGSMPVPLIITGNDAQDRHVFFRAAPAPMRTPWAEPTLAERLQAALDAGVNPVTGKGIAAAVILPDGWTWTGASGISHGHTFITPEMPFASGSIHKSFTAATILQMAEEGLIHLDDQLGQWLPTYPYIDDTITIRQLLNHTSGIFDMVDNHDFWVAIFADPARVWTPGEMVLAFQREALFPPGAGWNYSSSGYALLRVIIMNISGTDTATAYRDRFFTPLGMANSFTSMGEALPPHVAHGWWDLNGDGAYDDFSVWPRTAFISGTGGEVWSTAEDLARWGRALLHDRVVLGQPILDQMLTLYSPCTGEEFMVDAYGLGVMRFNPDLVDGLEAIGHGGNAPGFAAGYFYLPEYGISIGIMDNTEEGDSMGATMGNLLEVIVNHVDGSR